MSWEAGAADVAGIVAQPAATAWGRRAESSRATSIRDPACWVIALVAARAIGDCAHSARTARAARDVSSRARGRVEDSRSAYPLARPASRTVWAAGYSSPGLLLDSAWRPVAASRLWWAATGVPSAVAQS